MAKPWYQTWYEDPPKSLILYIVTRILGSAVCISFALIFVLLHMPKEIVNDYEDTQCEIMIPFEPLVEFVYLYDIKYQMVEYLQYNKSRQKLGPINEKEENSTKIDEIPVLVFSVDYDDQASQAFLSALIKNRTEGKPFRFRWFSVYFTGHSALVSGNNFKRQIRYVRDVLRWMKKHYPNQKPIIIGETSGILPALQYAMHDMDEKNSHMNSELLIFESTPTNIQEYVDFLFKDYYLEMQEKWNKHIEKSKTGVISFESTDDWLSHPSAPSLRGAIRIPTWTIENVTDQGISYYEMLRCKPFLNHIADLIMAYGEDHKHKTGNAILRTFQNSWINAKISKLMKPMDATSRWSYGTFGPNAVSMKFVAPCLKAVTIVRRNAHILRKAVQENRKDVFIGFFRFRKYEHAKFFLESDEEDCNTVADYKDSNLDFIEKFEDGLDSHYFFFASIVTSTFLFVLECGKASILMEYQLISYLAFFYAVYSHMFNMWLFLYPFQRSGMIMGFGAALSGHFFFSNVDQLLITCFRWSFDVKVAWLRSKVNCTRRTLIFIVTFLYIFSDSLSNYLLFLLLISTSRQFLIVPMVFSAIPLSLKFSIIDILTTISNHFTGKQLRSTSLILSIVPSINVTTLAYIIIFGLTVCDTKLFDRYRAKQISFTLLIIQCFLAHFPLEFHYASVFVILAVNLFSVMHIPQALTVPVFYQVDLEDQLIAIEKLAD